MYLIIDCNIFVSAMLGSKNCSLIFEEAFRNHRVFYTTEILCEYENKLNHPKFMAQRDRGELIWRNLLTLGKRMNRGLVRCLSYTKLMRSILPLTWLTMQTSSSPATEALSRERIRWCAGSESP